VSFHIDPFDGLEKLYKTISRRHGIVHVATPAEMNGKPGFLGVSSALYTRVWFDTEDDSKTLFTSFNKNVALQRYRELKKQYGK
jgi:hypothetical protein